MLNIKVLENEAVKCRMVTRARSAVCLRLSPALELRKGRVSSPVRLTLYTNEGSSRHEAHSEVKGFVNWFKPLLVNTRRKKLFMIPQENRSRKSSPVSMLACTSTAPELGLLMSTGCHHVCTEFYRAVVESVIRFGKTTWFGETFLFQSLFDQSELRQAERILCDPFRSLLPSDKRPAVQVEPFKNSF